jgi:hypothetical protein
MNKSEFLSQIAVLQITEKPYVSRTKRDIPLKDKTVIPSGIPVECYFSPLHRHSLFAVYGQNVVRLSIERAHQNLRGFGKAPSIATIEKWDMERGISKTPLGRTVEPDGHDENGCPSWQELVLF